MTIIKIYLFRFLENENALQLLVSSRPSSSLTPIWNFGLLQNPFF